MLLLYQKINHLGPKAKVLIDILGWYRSPIRGLRAVAGYCGLPWAVLPVSLDVLRAIIEDALHRLDALAALQ